MYLKHPNKSFLTQYIYFDSFTLYSITVFFNLLFFRLTSKNNFYQVLNIADAYKETNFNREIDRTSGYRTKQVLCAPIVTIAGGTTKITGVLQVLNRTGTHLENGFSLHDEELIIGFTKQISIALDSIIKNQNESDVKVRRFLYKYQNVCVSRAWNSWQHSHNVARRKRYIQTRAMQYWSRQKYSRAFTAWIYMLDERKRLKELMDRVLRRMERNGMHAGFQSWKRYAIYKRANEEMMVSIEDLKRER